MTETTETLSDRLAQLQVNLAERRRRVSQLEVEERRAQRAVARARLPLEEYLQACEADGVEPDAAREAELRRPVEEAQARMDFEPVLIDGRVSSYVARDREALARLRGAQEGAERAERALDSFAREHDAALALERLPRRVWERDALLVAVRRLLDVEQAWADGLREETAAAHLVGRTPPDPADPPRDAVIALARWLRSAEADRDAVIPMPANAREAAA